MATTIVAMHVMLIACCMCVASVLLAHSVMRMSERLRALRLFCCCRAGGVLQLPLRNARALRVYAPNLDFPVEVNAGTWVASLSLLRYMSGLSAGGHRVEWLQSIPTSS